MAGLKITVIKDTVTNKLEGAPDKLRAILLRNLDPLASDIRQQVQSAIHSRSGKLAGTVQARVFEQGPLIGIRASMKAPYARMIEDGGRTPAHTIMPVSVKALAFQSAVGGLKSTMTFAAEVHHPGGHINAQHPLRKTVDGAKGQFRSIVKDALLETMA